METGGTPARSAPLAGSPSDADKAGVSQEEGFSFSREAEVRWRTFQL
jgi:hypothetical protein